LPFLKDHAKSHNQLYPAIIRPRFARSSFSGSAKIRSFLLCQAPSQPYPERDGKIYGLFGIRKSLLSKTPFALKGAQRYETFRFVKPLSLSSTHFLTGQQRYKVFDIHKYRPIPSLPYPFIKDHAKSHNQTLPCHHPPRLLPLLFFRECKITKFLPCQVPSHPLPQDMAKLRTFGHSQLPPLSQLIRPQRPLCFSGAGTQRYGIFSFVKPPSDSLSSKINQGLLGSAKLRSFSLCQALLSASLFVRERKGTKILI